MCIYIYIKQLLQIDKKNGQVHTLLTVNNWYTYIDIYIYWYQIRKYNVLNYIYIYTFNKVKIDSSSKKKNQTIYSA